MKEFLENIYSGIKQYTGLKNISPLKKHVKIKPSKNGAFPLVGFLTQEMKNQLEEVLNVKIHDVEYYEQALTHRSYLQVQSNRKLYSNERLEFLGDAVLGMIIAEYLFTIYSDIPEGDLTKLRARLVNKHILAAVAKQLRIDHFLQMSYGAARSLVNGSDSMLADAMESLIAAIYIDSGVESARDFIIDTLLPILTTFEKEEDENYKSILLEVVQAKGAEHPKYQLLSEEGPDHNKEFHVTVSVNGKVLAVGVGKSKKAAEQNAAKIALPKAKIMFG